MLMRNNSGPGRRDVPLRVRIFPHTAARPLPGLRRRDRQGRRRHRDASLHADPELLLRHVQGPAGGVFDRRLISWFLIPDKERDLESEDLRFREFLGANGYDTSFYGESLVEQVKSTAFKLNDGR
jgi:hypothetical protein